MEGTLQLGFHTGRADSCLLLPRKTLEHEFHLKNKVLVGVLNNKYRTYIKYEHKIMCSERTMEG